MEVEHFNGAIKKQKGEILDLLEAGRRELKKEYVKSVKIIKPMPKMTIPKKRK